MKYEGDCIATKEGARSWPWEGRRLCKPCWNTALDQWARNPANVQAAKDAEIIKLIYGTAPVEVNPEHLEMVKDALREVQ